MDKHSSVLQKFVNCGQKSFIKLRPGALWHKFTHDFCKIDHFINVNYICQIELKRSRLALKKVIKFAPKNFMKLTQSQPTNIILG